MRGGDGNPHSQRIEFYISKTHLFGLSAALLNFNRLPEMMTAVCRRMGMSPSWHFVDDLGTLDFEESLQKNRHGKLEGMAASESVGFIYKLVGRPFKKEKHLPPSKTQVHLGLQNEFKDFQANIMSLEQKKLGSWNTSTQHSSKPNPGRI